MRLQDNIHLQYIRKTILGAQTKWREIGKGLGISSCDLDAMDVENRTAGGKLEAVLTRWMHTGAAKIDQLLDVLKSPDLDETGIANDILRTRDPEKRRRLGLN